MNVTTYSSYAIDFHHFPVAMKRLVSTLNSVPQHHPLFLNTILSPACHRKLFTINHFHFAERATSAQSNEPTSVNG
jgi:hypothetical protein